MTFEATSKRRRQLPDVGDDPVDHVLLFSATENVGGLGLVVQTTLNLEKAIHHLITIYNGTPKSGRTKSGKCQKLDVWMSRFQTGKISLDHLYNTEKISIQNGLG